MSKPETFLTGTYQKPNKTGGLVGMPCWPNHIPTSMTRKPKGVLFSKADHKHVDKSFLLTVLTHKQTLTQFSRGPTRFSMNDHIECLISIFLHQLDQVDKPLITRTEAGILKILQGIHTNMNRHTYRWCSFLMWSFPDRNACLYVLRALLLLSQDGSFPSQA